MATATLIMPITTMRGDAALFELDPPLDGVQYVVASAVDLHSSIELDLFDGILGIDRDAETMLFPADSTGAIQSWGELAMVPYKSFEAALDQIGYEVA